MSLRCQLPAAAVRARAGPSAGEKRAAQCGCCFGQAVGQRRAMGGRGGDMGSLANQTKARRHHAGMTRFGNEAPMDGEGLLLTQDMTLCCECDLVCRSAG